VKRVLPLFALTLAAPLAAVPGGNIGTLPGGTYRCELPGDALGPVGHRVPESDFIVLTASAYRASGGQGSYLLIGDRMVMTSGPFRGRRFHRITPHFLRLIGPDGQDSQMRCVRRRGMGR
jgi:hypothetical protein